MGLLWNLFLVSLTVAVIARIILFGLDKIYDWCQKAVKNPLFNANFAGRAIMRDWLKRLRIPRRTEDE
tara:strand:+ start:3853 stop:4056 length:204 start_codon:yes stop_codon:yes gene_type:complete